MFINTVHLTAVHSRTNKSRKCVRCGGKTAVILYT